MEIKHKKRFFQDLGFETLMYGSISPSDIDAIIEYKDKAYVIIEVKYKNAEVSTGQRILLERLSKDLSKFKPILVVVTEHSIENVNDKVIIAECNNRQIFYNGKWKKDNRKLKESIDSFLEFVNESKDKKEAKNS